MKQLLLDTHVWIWFSNGNEDLSKPTRKLINQADKLFIAAISLWELSMLEAKNRIVLEMPCVEWINQSLALANIQVLPLTTPIAVDSCHLPGNFHDDPADRLIVASARVANLKLMTRDQRILSYSKQKHVSCVKV